MTARSFGLSLRVVGETLAICVPTLVDSARRTLTKEACDRRLASWARKVVEAARIDLEVLGRERFDPARTYVLMSNHQSHIDVPVLYHVLGGSMRMVAKIELFRIPIFGPALREAGFVAVDRKDRHSAIANLARAKQALASGISIWIAPEGTRSLTGELGPFKKGGFNLAYDTGSPILPISIDGTRHVLPAQSARAAYDVCVRVTIHPALEPPPGPRRDAINELMWRARAVIASGL